MPDLPNPVAPDPEGARPEDGPRMLASIDPSSPAGRMLRDAVARLRFADVDKEIRKMAQDVLDGRKSARDLLMMPEMRPYDQQGARSLRQHLDEIYDEEKKKLLGEA